MGTTIALAVGAASEAASAVLTVLAAKAPDFQRTLKRGLPAAVLAVAGLVVGTCLV